MGTGTDALLVELLKLIREEEDDAEEDRAAEITDDDDDLIVVAVVFTADVVGKVAAEAGAIMASPQTRAAMESLRWICMVLVDGSNFDERDTTVSTKDY